MAPSFFESGKQRKAKCGTEFIFCKALQYFSLEELNCWPLQCQAKSRVLTFLLGVKKRETVSLQLKSTESAEKIDKAISFSKTELL